MPVFDYKCTDCAKTYDIYHKVREVVEDILCPTCGSKSYKKLISVPTVSVSGSSSSSVGSDLPPCGVQGGCRNGNCSI